MAGVRYRRPTAHSSCCSARTDRTASTPTETPASSARTPSTPLPSPTATDAPGTAAATAPPAVSGSAETDREALVALYNATNGQNWFENDNWLSDAPLGEWKGVNTNDDGRVLAASGNQSRALKEEAQSLWEEWERLSLEAERIDSRLRGLKAD